VKLRRAYLVTTFVPPAHVDAMIEALAAEVGLVFGPYDQSAWWSAPGVEQFRPLPGASPTTGSIGVTERVPTVRLEFAIPCDEDLLHRALEIGIRAHHPWQEPAVFVQETLTTATRMVGDTL
jgi:hypothetical protein